MAEASLARRLDWAVVRRRGALGWIVPGLLVLALLFPAVSGEFYLRLANVFGIVRPYVVFVPLYGSLWSMAACSDALDAAAVTPAEIDRRIAKRGLAHLQYYNGATHQAVFALPNFVRDLTTGARLGPRLVSKRRVAGGGK